MKNSESESTKLDDVEMVENLIKKYRENNPPAIAGGDTKEINSALIYVLLVCFSFSLGCFFVSELLGSLMVGLVVAIIIYCFICGKFVIREVKLSKWKNDFVSQEDLEKIAMCDIQLKEMLRVYIKATDNYLTYSALAILIEQYKYRLRKEQKIKALDVAR
ncbi:TPA: hypothetical protein ACLGO4_004597 [Salmonella enterica]